MTDKEFGVSDDGEKESGGQSRPETAADRRARRAAAGGTNTESGDDGASAVGAEGDRPRGKSAGSAPARRKDGTAPAKTKHEGDEKLPLPKRLVRFIRQVVDELRKVIWPTRKQMVTYTMVVISFVAFMVTLVWALDWVFAKVVFEIFG